MHVDALVNLEAADSEGLLDVAHDLKQVRGRQTAQNLDDVNLAWLVQLGANAADADEGRIKVRRGGDVRIHQSLNSILNRKKGITRGRI